MQKTHSRSRTILLSVLMVLMCVSLIIGATFALFTDREDYAIGVKTGKIDVQGTLTMTGAWSQGQSVNTREAGTSIENGYSLPQGGTVTLTGGKTINFDNMSLGDGASFTLGIVNSSTVNMKYSVYIVVNAAEGDNSALANSLQLAVDGHTVDFNNSAVSVVNWTEVDAGMETITPINFEITLPWDTINNFAEVTAQQSISMTIVLEAVQANAFTGTIGTGDQSYDTLLDAMSAAEEGGTISLGSNMEATWPTAEEMAGIDKPVNIVGAGQGLTKINSSGDNPIVLPEGSSVSGATINGNVTASAGAVLDDVTVNGTITYTGSAAAGQSTFSTLAKVSRAYAPAANSATITLTNATVFVNDADRAISVVGANLVLTDSTVTLVNSSYKNAATAVYVEDAAANISNSDISITYPGTSKGDTAFGLWLENTDYTNWDSRPVSVISDSEIAVIATGEVDYLAQNEQALRMRAAVVELYNTNVTGGTAVALFRNSAATVSGGEIVGDVYAISGSNTMGSFTLNVTDGAVLRTTGQRSTLYITPQSNVTIGGGAVIEGYTAIEAKMGTIIINDATIRSTATENKLAVTPDGGNAKPDGAAIKLETRQYGFTTMPEGYKDPYYGNNSLDLTISADAVIETAGAPYAITYYNRGSVEQTVQVNNYSQYVITGVAYDGDSFVRTFRSGGIVKNIVLAADASVSSIPNIGGAGTYYDDEGRVEKNAATLSPCPWDMTIDLNGKTLTTNQNSASFILHGYDLVIENGTLSAPNMGGVVAAVFNIQSGSSITLDDVDFTTNGCGLYPLGNAAEVNVINGSHITGGAYAVATNAASINNYGVVINLTDSTFECTGTDNCPVLINIPGTLNMNNCTVTGDRQGVIVRGGEANISDTTINLSGAWLASKEGVDNRLETWSAGNEVPSAALVIGNDNRSAYANYSATATLNDVEIIVESGNAPVVYIRGNESSDNGATLNYSDMDLDDITIGGGYVTINLAAGNYTLPMFSAAGGGNLTINGYVDEDGTLGTVVAPNGTGLDFGGIVVANANNLTLTVNDIAFEGTSNADGSRGIVVNNNNSYEVNVQLLTVNNCTFNTLTTGIYFGKTTTATITDCEFTNCTAGMGGTEGMSGTLTVSGCTFAGNDETIGWAGSGTLVISGAEGCDSFNDYTSGSAVSVPVTDGNYNSAASDSEEVAA